ncbi:MAG: carbon storage regulator CsrA [Armatimonadota bacterium]
MLILARKVGQSIVIAGEIEVTIVEVRGDQVRLGINAPRSIAVHRKELLQQVAMENMEAAGTAESIGKSTSDLDIEPIPQNESSEQE